MQSIEILTELIEKAASAVNIVSADDPKEIEDLQEIIKKINQALVEINDGSDRILEEAKATTSDSIKVLQEILLNEVNDTARSIDTVSKAVSTLQNLINRINNAENEPVSKSVETESEKTDETESQKSHIVSDEDVPLILDFITESAEHIESAEAGLLELENKSDDKDTINRIFRGFHTIKGMAGFLNLAEIGSLAHSAENILGLARDGKLILGGDNTDIVFESMDMMKKMITELKNSIEAGKPITPRKGLPELLAKLQASAEGTSVPVKKPEANPADSAPASRIANQDEQLEKTLTTEYEQKRSIAPEKKIHSGDEKIKVSTTRLDNLINMVGELVIAQLMVSEEVNKSSAIEHQLNSKVAHQSKIVRELQELSLSMRMVPISGVFQKMARVVRDLTHKAGKNVEFTTVGEDTELDRSIVDKIADPLVHMVRNSVDHGIEPEQERTKSGKNPTGKIELRAFHQAGNIVIEIQDDGKGLDKERILKKAVENGIVETGHELTDDEIYKLIFHAGLSTAQKITNVSGRGVGMDVVRKNVESLQGRIDISTAMGQGTTFTIRMPLTLAIIDGQVIKVGENNRYIIPINSIKQSLRPTRRQLSTVQNRGLMAEVQDELIPIIRLYSLFGVTPITEDPAESLLVVVEDDGRKSCLLVDELLGQQQVVIKSLGDGLGKVKGISGGAIMGDGKVSLILDIPGLIDLARGA